MTDNPADASRLVLLTALGTPEQAHLVRNRLEAEGIPAVIQDEAAGWQTYMAGNSAGVRVLVGEADAQRARQLFGLDRPPPPDHRPPGAWKSEWGWSAGMAAGALIGATIGAANGPVGMMFGAAAGAMTMLMPTLGVLHLRSWLRDRRADEPS